MASIGHRWQARPKPIPVRNSECPRGDGSCAPADVLRQGRTRHSQARLATPNSAVRYGQHDASAHRRNRTTPRTASGRVPGKPYASFRCVATPHPRLLESTAEAEELNDIVYEVGVKVLHDWPKQHLPATDARIPRMCTTTFARTRACYTAHMPNDTTPDASGDVQTRTEEHHDASGRAPLAPTTQPAPPPPLETKSAHTRIDASGRERVRKPPPENWIVIDQAMARFTAAGLPIKLRTLQKYCLREKIRSTLAVTDKNTFEYFLDPASIADFITRNPSEGPNRKWREQTPARDAYARRARARARTRSRRPWRVRRPYVKRLEREIDDYKQKYDTLQASGRARPHQAPRNIRRCPERNACQVPPTRQGQGDNHTNSIRNSKQYQLINILAVHNPQGYGSR